MSATHAPHALGQVLCVGEDGHIEVETGLEGECSSSSLPVQQQTSGQISVSMAGDSLGDADHCGDCSDIPLDDHEELNIVRLRAGSSDQVDVMFPAISSLDLATVRIPSVHVSSISAPFISLNLVTLRSVLLQR